MSNPHEREVAVFEAALQLPPEQREAYLEQTCGGVQELLQRVRSLLTANEQQTDFLASAPNTAVSRAPSEKPGDRIGPYKLLQLIGEGGCGVVYMAEQDKPIHRRVALKIIKLGMDTKQVIARFEAERQALALMDHPCIAKVHDAGATATGRPYFVMELVRGVRITDYCDDKKLATQLRLELFVQVCQAVQHAHQKGIIHRDLKPSNILITVDDGKAVAKVIDFGIAKATTGERLTDKTIFTAFEQFIGTPAYVSPEQAEITSVDIDTRSDIYSLGVLLYELLTGQTPFDAKELLKAGLDEMRRTLREKEPVRPSTRLSTLGAEDLTTAANRRGLLDAPNLVKALRGDLDWIVMKCLEKDRAHRYETANGLASDIQRHLNSEPVAARPPSGLYRFQKMVRRNKMAFGVAAALIVTLLLGIVASTWEAVRARRAEGEQIRSRQVAEEAQRSEQLLRTKAEAGEKKAGTEAAKSAAVARFLQDMLQGVGPSVAHGRDTAMLREILDKTARRLDTDHGDQPAVESDLRATLGGVYAQLGDYTNSIAMHARALELRKSLYGEEHPAVADSFQGLGDALHLQGRLEESERMKRKALAIKQHLLPQGDAEIVNSQCELGLTLLFENRCQEAETLQRTALATQRSLLGSTNTTVATTLLRLALTLDESGKYAEAEKLASEGILIHDSLHNHDDQNVGHLFDALGMALEWQDRYAEAESAFLEGLAVRRRVLGDRHPDLAWSFIHIARQLSRQDKLEEAERMSRAALAISTDDLSVCTALNRLTTILQAEGKSSEAESLYFDWLESRKKSSGSRFGTARTLNGFAWMLATDPDPKLTHRTNAVGMAEELVAITSRTNADYLDTLAAAYANNGDFGNAVRVEKAAMLLLQTEGENEDFAFRLKLYESNSAFRDDEILATRVSRLLAAKMFTEAEPLARECVALRERRLPQDLRHADSFARFFGRRPLRERRIPQELRLLNAYYLLSDCLLGQRKFREAEPLLLCIYGEIKQRRYDILAAKPRLDEVVHLLLRLYEETNQPDEAANWKQTLAQLDLTK